MHEHTSTCILACTHTQTHLDVSLPQVLLVLGSSGLGCFLTCGERHKGTAQRAGAQRRVRNPADRDVCVHCVHVSVSVRVVC
jgi:hypothetical protein